MFSPTLKVFTLNNILLFILFNFSCYFTYATSDLAQYRSDDGNNVTIDICKPKCTGRSCIPDGCGGFCGRQCRLYETCDIVTGSCICQPHCDDETDSDSSNCGKDNQCGGLCPPCQTPENISKTKEEIFIVIFFFVDCILIILILCSIYGLYLCTQKINLLNLKKGRTSELFNDSDDNGFDQFVL